ncbi:tRNA-dihydrouridine synthase family protein [archaeon]|jgi:tRNA-dihydrouridine synthase B|nr:tRNA-dihydrouridine synthase family protein [archaeon]MBT3577293.1 tRNA-dihydrouridine synthase family protein [archaeon]MBT6820463.1 tRNA-dihydrouridine synthase family protein [archaeon]MBT6956288.1 tRNA-dihydrouridine synthase family protein [archaeon]MBT7025277.1 tRNA-dihydrouridine synthase family protein [archaeon]
MEDKIGNLKLKNRFILAPMLEPNDIAFRILCKKSGAALTYTGMTSPLSKQKLQLQDKPAMQLFGNSEKGIKEFMKKYDKKVSLWDFNLGCPSKLSKRLCHGAFMHDDLETIEKILKIMRESTKKPITIKLRKSKNAIKIAKLAEKYVDAIGIHPRTFKQGYSGEPDLAFAKKLKKSSKVPIIYSGNVDEKNAKELLKTFDFVMVGREAIGDPRIFARLLGKDLRAGFKDYLKLAIKHKLFFRQIKYQAMNFTKGIEGAKKLRLKLIGAKNVRDISGAINL